MSEPLDEASEVAWLRYLDRFDQEIYPVLFEKRGYTKGEALIAWSLSRLEESTEAVKEAIEKDDRI